MKSKIIHYHQKLAHAGDHKNFLLEKLTEFKKQLAEHNSANPIINDCFVTVANQIAQFKFEPDKYLSGTWYSLKDNIVTSTDITTGGSKFLANYFSPFDATVYTDLTKVGALNLAKANLDEFGLGGTGLLSAYGQVSNPWNSEYVIGGSSSGSAYLVATDLVHFAIATDTGDSIRCPASNAGIVGFKPSYGAISRYGVFPFCPSLDTVGIMAQYTTDVGLVFQHLEHQDPQDCTTWPRTKIEFHGFSDQPQKPIKLAVFRSTFDYASTAELGSIHYEAMKTNFWKTIDQLTTNHPITIEVIDFPQTYLDVIEALYAITAYCEASSCYANLTGMTFGPEIQDSKNIADIFFQSRKLLGSEFKTRILIGGMFLDSDNYEQLYIKSKKVRSKIEPFINQLLAQYDAILLPGNFGTPIKIKQVINNSLTPINNISKIMKFANFYGLPSITIPWTTFNGLPIGLNLFSKFQSDWNLLQVAYYLEQWLEQ